MRFKFLSIVLLCAAAAVAQVPNPTSQGTQATPPTADTSGNVPLFRVQVVDRTVPAVNYFHRSGSTEIGFRGTELDPEAKGNATVESRRGRMVIDGRWQGLIPPERFGSEYLTYVLWAITPEGRAQNLGELTLDGSKSAINVTTDLQAFGLIVTAEPYWGVTMPSDAVVAENYILPKTTGIIQPIVAKYELLPRGQYTLHADQTQLKTDRHERVAPLDLREARNAVELARAAGADQYASDSLSKADTDLRNAEDMWRSKTPSKQVATYARQAVQDAEDARVITLRRKQDEVARQQREQTEQAQQQAQEAQAAQQAAEEQRAAEQRRAEEAAQQAQQAQADLATAQAAREQAQKELEAAQQARQEAEAARQQALQQQQQAEQQAQQANQRATQAEQEKDALRQRLQQQLNTILETRETARGLIVNMSDVLFDTGKYTLKPGAREKLAKVAGILLAYPGLKVQVEGYTDSTGTQDFNQRLSEKRAMTVRDYLVGQGINMNSVTAQGFGEAMPVADNRTAAGRQQNRRVEMVVSGEPIGVETQAPSESGNRTLERSANPGTVPNGTAAQSPATQQQPPRPGAIGAPVNNNTNTNQQQPTTPQVPKR